MPADECPSITGKVTWQPSHSAWCIHGKREGGVALKNRVRVGGRKEAGFFKPAGHGCKNAREIFLIERRKAYIAAIELWNKEDKSTRERIEVPFA